MAEPPLDITTASEPVSGRAGSMAALLPTGSLRRAPAPVEGLPGVRDGGWWVQDAAAALPARVLLAGLGAPRVADLCAAPGGQDRATRGVGRAGDGARHLARASRTSQGKPGPAPAVGGGRGGGPSRLDAGGTLRRGAAGRALLGAPVRSGDIPTSRATRRRTTWRGWRRSSARCSTRRRRRCGRAEGWSTPSARSSPRKDRRRSRRSSPPRPISTGFPSSGGNRGGGGFPDAGRRYPDAALPPPGARRD